MTPNEFRRIALGMQGASEGEHMAPPADADTVGEAMTLAWQLRVNKAKAKPARKTAGSAKKGRR